MLASSVAERFIGKALDDRFTPDDFKTEVFLGTGSFGRVTLVTFKEKRVLLGWKARDGLYFMPSP